MKSASHMFKAATLANLVPGILALSGTLKAADILHTPIGDGSSGFIMVAGQLDANDEQKFNLIAQRYTKGAILFASPGGNLLAGIEIGRIIRMRNFATGVAPNTRCASACALAWLGGTQRFMSSTSLIGFHAAAIVDKGSITETGLGNAVVGAYLTTLGLPLSAVIYISKSPPDQMTWLNLSAAKQTGIDVMLLDLTAPGASTTANPPGARVEAGIESRHPAPPFAKKVPELKPSARWVIVASRGDLKEAVAIAQEYKRTFPDVQVVKSENGQYGITIGQFDIIQDPTLMTRLMESKRIPKDSYLTSGKRFVSIAWQ